MFLGSLCHDSHSFGSSIFEFVSLEDLWIPLQVLRGQFWQNVRHTCGMLSLYGLLNRLVFYYRGRTKPQVATKIEDSKPG